MGAWDHMEPLSHCYLAQAPLVLDLGWRIRGEVLLAWKIYGLLTILVVIILLAVAVRKQ